MCIACFPTGTGERCLCFWCCSNMNIRKKKKKKTTRRRRGETLGNKNTARRKRAKKERERDPLFVEIYNDYHLPMMKLKSDKTRKIYVYAYRQCDVVYYFSLWCVVGPICWCFLIFFWCRKKTKNNSAKCFLLLSIDIV